MCVVSETLPVYSVHAVIAKSVNLSNIAVGDTMADVKTQEPKNCPVNLTMLQIRIHRAHKNKPNENRVVLRKKLNSCIPRDFLGSREAGNKPPPT